MATLVLTTVGTLVGGPVGGAIGALIGQQADRALLAPKGRQGARLGDLAVQASRYGAPIPRLFGTMRVAGSVIWATELRESEQRSGGGKGGGRTTSYAYFASFAVALSARPILAVGRIWADGKLLRGAGGDWKTDTGFRLHTGGEEQPVDPLIASAEGAGATPAFRGLAYAVFEDLQLADFGNRIPSLTFEVVADPGPVGIGAIATDLSGGAITGETRSTLAGYAALGDSVRGALQGIGEASPFVIADSGDGLVIGDAADVPIPLPMAPDLRIERRAAGTLPDEVALTYYDPARDHQAGLQRARRGGPARRVSAIELAAAVDAATAKALAESRLSRDWAARLTASASLPWRHLAIRPGAAVTLAGRPERWRVAATTLERAALRVDFVAEGPAADWLVPTSAGRAATAPDLPHGPTTIALLDLPALDPSQTDVPRLWIAAAGASPGWRRADLLATLDGGASWTPIGATAAPAIIGATASALPAGRSMLRDDRITLDVTLLHDEMTLSGSDAVLSSATINLAMVGEELLQFTRAERIAPRTWRLDGLLRGRRGTEWAATGEAPGARFVLIEAASLKEWALPVTMRGAAVRVMARGVADASPPIVEAIATGRALAPPAPVRLTAGRRADGAIEVHWLRRSRQGFAWLDGADAPLGQSEERYRITITGGAATRVAEASVPHFLYTPAMQVADGSVPGAPLAVTVAQAGEAGTWSTPAAAMLP